MRYDGNIRSKLKLVAHANPIFKRIPYTLQYEDFKLYGNGYEKVLEYVQKYYINNNNIIEENLINDLNTFKTYRDDIQQEITMKSLIEIIWSVVVTIVPVLIAIYIGYIALKDDIEIQKDDFINFIVKNINIALWLLLFISAIYLGLSISKITKLSENYKLKYINNVIYTLETIKEDMYRKGNSGTESDERYEGLELTEVQEIRTYAYKATGNKYSPRAMYERKRR